MFVLIFFFCNRVQLKKHLQILKRSVMIKFISILQNLSITINNNTLNRNQMIIVVIIHLCFYFFRFVIMSNLKKGFQISKRSIMIYLL